MSATFSTAPDRILRRADVELRTGLSRSKIYDLVSKGAFPAPIHLTPRCVGWVNSEIDSWLASRIAVRGRP